MKKILNIALVIGVLLITNAYKAKEKSFSIQGNISGLSAQTLVRVLDRETVQVLDSVFVRNGKFSLKGQVAYDTPTDLTLQFREKNTYRNIELFIGNEDITVTGNIKQQAQIIIKGSKHHQYKELFESQLNPLSNKRQSYISTMIALRRAKKWNDSLHNAYWGNRGLINVIDLETQKIEKKLITEHVNTYYALRTLKLTMSEYKKDELKTLYNRLNEPYKNSKYGKALRAWLASTTLKKGDKFINFKALNTKGQEKYFSSFFGKKYVLIDFSSPGCRFCVKSVPTLKKVETNYSQKLKLISYFVDRHKGDFLKFKKRRKWTTLWNKEGRYSDAFMKYKVEGTPNFLLFDKNGKLIKKWFGYSGPALYDEIGKLIGMTNK